MTHMLLLQVTTVLIIKNIKETPLKGTVDNKKHHQFKTTIKGHKMVKHGLA